MTNITEDRAIAALNAARPKVEDLASEWYIGRREQVLQQVVDDDGSGPSTGDQQRRPVRARRWILLVAGVAIVAAASLIAQTLLPTGSPGSPQLVMALDRLAAAVPPSSGIPEGTFEMTVVKETHVNPDGKGGHYTAKQTSRQWLAADNWLWEHGTGDNGTEYVLSHLLDPCYDLSGAPTDPKELESYLRPRVTCNGPVELGLFDAAFHLLHDARAPQESRAAALRMLGGVKDLSVVENTTDPSGRPATKVSVLDLRDPPHRKTYAMYLDSATAQMLAYVESGDATRAAVWTERRIVDRLPAEIVKVLGTKRVEKSVP